MKIKKLDIELCKNSVKVENDRKVMNWLVNKQTEDFKSGNKTLTSDLRKELLNIFGRQNKVITDEFRHYLWILEYKNMIFNVYSASGRGTDIEVCNIPYEEMWKNKRSNDIIEFLEELSNLIN